MHKPPVSPSREPACAGYQHGGGEELAGEITAAFGSVTPPKDWNMRVGEGSAGQELMSGVVNGQ